MRRFYTAAAICLLTAAAAIGVARADDADVVARVGNVNVTVEQVRSYIASLDPRAQAEIVSNPSLLAQAVRMYMAQQLVVKEALDKKWEQQPNVAAALERQRQAAIGQLYLESVSMPPADFPSDAQVQSAYDSNKTLFVVPRQFHLAQIVVAEPKNAPKAADDEAHRKLKDLQKKLRAHNADFAAIARASSDDAESAKKGGDVGWVQENQVVPDIRNAAQGLSKNDVSEPIRLDAGWVIIKLIDTKASYTRPLSEVRPAIVRQLRVQQENANSQSYLNKVLQQNQPAVDELALSKIFQKPSAATPH